MYLKNHISQLRGALAYLLLTTTIACKQSVEKIDKEQHANAVMQDENQTINATQTTAFLKEMQQSIVIENNQLTTVKNWGNYPVLNQQITELTTDTTGSLRTSFNAFKTSTPAYLLIDDVQDAVEDVEKELLKLEEIAPKKDIKESLKKDQITKVQNAFNELKNNVLRTKLKYINSTPESAETYLKEVNSYTPNKSTSHRLNDK